MQAVPSDFSLQLTPALLTLGNSRFMIFGFCRTSPRFRLPTCEGRAEQYALHLTATVRSGFENPTFLYMGCRGFSAIPLGESEDSRDSRAGQPGNTAGKPECPPNVRQMSAKRPPNVRQWYTLKAATCSLFTGQNPASGGIPSRDGMPSHPRKMRNSRRHSTDIGQFLTCAKTYVQPRWAAHFTQ